jgi:hypothetical protein
MILWTHSNLIPNKRSINDTTMLHDRMNVSDVFLSYALQFLPSPKANLVSRFAWISGFSRNVHLERGGLRLDRFLSRLNLHA